MSPFEFLVNLYALIISIIGVILSTSKLKRFWSTRHLQKVWGIKDGDYVIVVCSELDNPDERQNVEDREFIYNLKYGDVDAYFEVVTTLLRLYPNIRLRVLSSGEAEHVRIDLARHLVLIGGPDYNGMTGRILKRNITRFQYRSPYFNEKSKTAPEEIVIFDAKTNKEYFELTDEKDFGYFERIKNPNNPSMNIILIGGCHTIGVAGAVKAFSMAESERGEIPEIVLSNAERVATKIKVTREFSVLISADRVGQTINTPIVEPNNIFVERGV